MEIFAIRTVMQLGILEALPETGTISLEDLSDKTGAQQSLIGTLHDGMQSDRRTPATVPKQGLTVSRRTSSPSPRRYPFHRPERRRRV